ncbi:LPS assembly lipoprotein LptE [Acidicapsa dinghuensis]|uniref:LPS assembly lipoprotein LptE n=1 Tax=Acidicapsa dinghuensis TaxID=2218256 RepID=A0ABW1EKF3_9BACT|nr:LPS assembly lipoprotein LptE [Acidicapsa dinghuensis]
MILPAVRRLSDVFLVNAVGICLLVTAGCGYHTVGSATHLPPDTRTLAVPVFATRTNSNHTEVAMTDAVVREFATRTRLRVSPDGDANADATLHGTILTQTVAPLTYNSQTQQSSSFLVTIVAAVTLKARDGRVLYRNDNYVFRQQYQATTDLPTFFDESPAAVERLSRDFARQLVADVLESF